MPISHDKNNHLAKTCVTMKYLMVEFYWKTKLSDVISDEYSNLSGEATKPNFVKTSVSIKTTNATQNISSKIRVKSSNRWKTIERSLPALYSIYFQQYMLKLFILLFLSIFILLIIWIRVTTSVVYSTSTQEHGGIVMIPK